MKKRVKKKKNKPLPRWIWGGVALLAAAFALTVYLAVPVRTPKIVYIPKGSVFNTVSHLQGEGVGLHWIDAFFLRIVGQPQQGWIDLKEERMSRIEFLYRLTTAKAATRTITLIPGETSVVFLKQLSQALSIDFDRLMNAYERHARMYEGNFVPDTYSVPNALSEEALIEHLLSQSEKTMAKWADEHHLSHKSAEWLRIVTKASVIQKEAASLDDMPYVSSVIDNRMKEGMRLQMDGSLNYGEYSHQKVTAHRIRTDKSPYNTYKNRGLPKDPVCNVSKEAIEAAIHPKRTDYLYFVRNKKGEHVYSSYFSTHRKNIVNATK